LILFFFFFFFLNKKKQLKKFTKRLELSFLTVFAFPNASRTGLETNICEERSLLSDPVKYAR